RIIIEENQNFTSERIEIKDEDNIIPEKNNLLIKAREAPYYPIEIVLNEKSIGKYDKKTLEEGFKKIID
ncbi:MAG: hypothetical protein ACFFB8_18125, partial [Promethearchaeota archaeon]